MFRKNFMPRPLFMVPPRSARFCLLSSGASVMQKFIVFQLNFTIFRKSIILLNSGDFWARALKRTLDLRNGWFFEIMIFEKIKIFSSKFRKLNSVVSWPGAVTSPAPILFFISLSDLFCKKTNSKFFVLKNSKEKR